MVSPSMIRCPYCNGAMENTIELGGTTVACPFCSRQFVLPMATVAIPTANVVSRSTALSRRHKSSSFGIGLIVAMAVLLAIVGGTAYFFMHGGKSTVRAVLSHEKGLSDVPVEFRNTITAYLDGTENNYEITQWYAPEPLTGARWIQHFDSDKLIQRFEKEGVAVRVLYRTNEGFDSWARHDHVFCITPELDLIEFQQGFRKVKRLETRDFVIGKPDDKVAQPEPDGLRRFLGIEPPNKTEDLMRMQAEAARRNGQIPATPSSSKPIEATQPTDR